MALKEGRAGRPGIFNLTYYVPYYVVMCIHRYAKSYLFLSHTGISHEISLYNECPSKGSATCREKHYFQYEKLFFSKTDVMILAVSFPDNKNI